MKNKVGGKQIAISVGCLLVVCFLCGGLGTIVYGMQRVAAIPTPEKVVQVQLTQPPAATDAPTATQAPSATLVPTTTSVPTATPEPSLTPEPTETEVPTATLDPDQVVAEEEEEYRRDVLRNADFLARQMIEFGDYNLEISENPFQLLDPDVQNRLRNLVRNLTRLGDKLSNISPVPDKYTRVQQWLTKVGPELHEMETDYLRGIENLEGDALLQAQTHLDNASTYAKNAVTELGKIK